MSHKSLMSHFPAKHCFCDFFFKWINIFLRFHCKIKRWKTKSSRTDTLTAQWTFRACNDMSEALVVATPPLVHNWKIDSVTIYIYIFYFFLPSPLTKEDDICHCFRLCEQHCHSWSRSQAPDSGGHEGQKVLLYISLSAVCESWPWTSLLYQSLFRDGCSHSQNFGSLNIKYHVWLTEKLSFSGKSLFKPLVCALECDFFFLSQGFPLENCYLVTPN